MHNILKEKRLEKNMTLEQVGKLVGVGKSTVRKWENGMIENMGRDKIVALSKALDISPLDILGVEKDEKTSRINNIYDQLTPERQEKVYLYAEKQLDEQSNNIVRIPSREEMTLAAHAADPDKIFTKEEIQKIHDYLDELDAEYDRKHGINKNDDK